MTTPFKPLVVDGQVAQVRDCAVYAYKEASLDFTHKDLVSHDSFLKSLANPGTRAFNIENLFEENLRPLIGAASTSYDDALLIAENDDAHPVATTTVTTKSKNGKDTTDFHIIINKEFGRSMIIGDAAPKGVKTAFAKAGIRYVDRGSAQALDEIRAGIADVVGKNEERVSYAFRYRNDVKDRAATKGLAAMLADKSGKLMYPKYVVKGYP